MAEKRQCACLTKQNQRCKKPPMQNKPFCYLHQGCDHPYSVQPVPVPVPVPVQVQVRPQITLKQMVTQPKNKPQHLETLPQGPFLNRSVTILPISNVMVICIG